jgi:hypothetical protein
MSLHLSSMTCNTLEHVYPTKHEFFIIFSCPSARNFLVVFPNPQLNSNLYYKDSAPLWLHHSATTTTHMMCVQSYEALHGTASISKNSEKTNVQLPKCLGNYPAKRIYNSSVISVLSLYMNDHKRARPWISWWHIYVDILRKLEKFNQWDLHNVLFENSYFGYLINESGLGRLKQRIHTIFVGNLKGKARRGWNGRRWENNSKMNSKKNNESIK